ncbi:MAG: endonuclease/exonuclease/phosphatase family protein [Chloroflexi bacterium]|nr:endonuclease/exonuclease/phosphatase family protein [Chloroflexota bacterium]
MRKNFIQRNDKPSDMITGKPWSHMKMVSWNCQGAFRKKAERIARYQPDIAVIQECECPARLTFAPDIPHPTACLWFGASPSKGVGIFSYTAAQFETAADYDAAIQYCIPIKVSGSSSLNLMAVWAMNHEDRQISYVGQVYRAIHTYRDFICDRETVLLGDFNSNKQWDRTRKVGNHSDVVAELASSGISSAYHEFFREAQGAELQSTFFLQRKREKGYHIDYCFVPTQWLPQISCLTVGAYEEWGQLSDHTPIFVEFN